ncbi:MAG: hypothetical protein VX951_04255 [Planctomycetota bacterium]|nr:hypothetical protein [Planctomycetota bacterium]
MHPVVALSVLCAILSAPVYAQTGAHATKVIAYGTNNQAGGGIFNPNNALGAPVANNLAVHSLGVGGFLTLGFNVTITDGPGADFLVFENAFAVSAGGPIFSEALFVEVSTNGQDFARFPTRYQGPTTSGGPYATGWAGYYSGFGGIKPSNGGKAGVDNFDVVQAGGDSFDLADLQDHPLVTAGKVDLGKITQLRLVDVIAGISKDSAGNTIQDPTAGSADINAVSVIHHTGNVPGTGPSVTLDIPKSGNFTIRLSNPGGLLNLDPTSLRVSLDTTEIPAILLLQMMSVTQIDSTSISLQLGGNLPPNFLFHLAVAVKNKAGHRSGHTRVH